MYCTREEREGERCGVLSHKDSNLDKQDQNLLCYHYTMGHSHLCRSSYRLILSLDSQFFIFICIKDCFGDKSFEGYCCCPTRIRTLTDRTKTCCASHYTMGQILFDERTPPLSFAM